MSALMDFLLRNAGNKGIMATLRCGLVENTQMRAWPLLARFDGMGSTQRARAVRTVAGLFAVHPENCHEGNMGTVCRRLCGSDEKPWEVGESGSAAPGPVGRRFMHLLNADREEICDRVCRLVRQAGSRGIAVNYAALERDLTEWPRAREAWAAEFWAPMKEGGEEEEGGVR